MTQRTFELDHTVASVFAKLTDPAFIVARSEAMGEIDANCEVERSDGKTRLNISRTVSREPEKIPRIIRKFGLRQTVVINEEWWDQDEGKVGRFRAHPGNLPVRLEAELQIVATAGGSELSITQRCKVNIPLIGATIEPLLLEQRQKDLDQEVAFLRQALA